MEETNEKKDTVEKEFVAFPNIAADVINVLLYQMEKQPRHLKDVQEAEA